MNDDGRQPIAIGYLGDSGNLKTQQSSYYSSTCLAKVFCFVKTRTVYFQILSETKQNLLQKMILIFQKHPPFECIYTESR